MVQKVVFCGKCIYGKQDTDKLDKGRLLIRGFLSQGPNPVFVCELDGKARFGAEGCDRGKSRPFTWRDAFR